MSAPKMPAKGGSYVRGEDGKLVLSADLKKPASNAGSKAKSKGD